MKPDPNWKPPTNKPKYKHDCTSCIFLGTVTINEELADIWIHPRPNEELGIRYDDIIYRHSSEPSDYGCTHPTYFSPLSKFGAVAIAMWCEYYGFDGYNWDGSLFKNNNLILRLHSHKL